MVCAVHNMAKKVSRILISNSCVQFSPAKPFTYASGLVGPIYCDNRRLLSFVEDRKKIVELFCDVIDSSGEKYDLVAGLATAGIPHAAFIANSKNMPMIYIRSSAKKHGKENQVEGVYSNGDRVILIEDLVNQAKSLEEAVLGARAVGLVVESCFAIVDYEMAWAKERIDRLGIKLYSLTNLTALVEVAKEMGLIDKSGQDLIAKWHQYPTDWK